MRRTTTTLTLATLALAAVPAAAAHAATLSVGSGCAASKQTPGGGDTSELTGSGFAPGAPITISGGAAPLTATADASGAFTAELPAQSSSSYTPKKLTLTATDKTSTATVGVQVVRAGSNAPLNGNPRETTTWRFAGFAAGKPIYGHFRFKGKTVADYRFGVGTGPCGALKVRARRVPTKLRVGTWTLQVDNHKTYSKKTVPAFNSGMFTVS